MSTVTCPGCSRLISLPAEEMALPSITCSRCEVAFTPAGHVTQPVTWSPSKEAQPADIRFPALFLLAVLICTAVFLFIRIAQNRPLF